MSKLKNCENRNHQCSYPGCLRIARVKGECEAHYAKTRIRKKQVQP